MSDYERKKEEAFRKAWEWSLNNSDQPGAKEFLQKYADKAQGEITKSDTIGTKAKQFAGMQPGQSIFDFIKQSGKEIIEQPGLGTQQAQKDVGKFLGMPDFTIQDDKKPETLPGKVARFSGEFFGPVGVGMPPGTSQVIGAATGTAAQKALKPVSKLVTKAKETWPTAAGIISTIPEKIYKYAAEKEKQGRSIFKKSLPKNYWGDKASKLMNDFNSTTKEFIDRVGEQKRVLRELPDRADTKEIIQDIKDHIKFKTSVEKETSALSRKEQSVLPKLIEDLTPGETEQTIRQMEVGPNNLFKFKPRKIKTQAKDSHIYDLQLAKENIDKILDYEIDPNKIFDADKIISPETEAMLRKVRFKINEKIGKANPELAKYNEELSRLFDIRKTLGGKLNSTQIANFLKRQGSQEIVEGAQEVTKLTGMTISEALEELENYLRPDQYFLEDIKDAAAKEYFDSLIPGMPGGSASKAGAEQHLRQELLNIASRLGIGASIGLKTGPIPALASLGLMSPKGQQKIIQTFYKPKTQSKGAQLLSRLPSLPEGSKAYTAQKIPRLLIDRERENR